MASVAIVFVAASLAGASAAQAAEVQVNTSRFADHLPSFSGITFRAAPGERNAVRITREDRTLVIADSGAPLRSPDGSCEISADASTARCTVPERLAGVDVELRDGNDRATSDVAPGGPEGFDAPDSGYVLDGGPGDDVLSGAELGDELRGGAGDDLLSGHGGADTVTDEAVDDGNGVNAGGTNLLDGGEGDDSLAGREGDHTMLGGPGADSLFTGGGTSALAGGDGDDRFTVWTGGPHTVDGGDGNDQVVRLSVHAVPDGGSAAIDGGPGGDLVAYELLVGVDGGLPGDAPGATIRLSSTQVTSGNGLPDQSDSLAGIEDATGSVGRDVLSGSDVANRLLGGDGGDAITGGGGADDLEGGAGNDALDAVDGEPDTVTCADGPYREAGDAVRADAVDAIRRCAEAPDTTPPDLAGTRVPRTIALARLRRRGLVVRLASGDASASRATAVLSTRGGRRLARRSRVFTGRAVLRLRPARAAVRRRGSLRLVLRVSDAAGNVARLRRTVRVR